MFVSTVRSYTEVNCNIDDKPYNQQPFGQAIFVNDKKMKPFWADLIESTENLYNKVGLLKELMTEKIYPEFVKQRSQSAEQYH